MVCIVKVMVFPAVRHRCKRWTVKKAECNGINAFKLWYWIRLLRVSWTTKRWKQSILKEISPEYSLGGLMLKLKLQYLAIWCKEPTHLKRPWCWERLWAGGEGDDKGWGGWMASPTRWTWVWANSGSWWWTGSMVCCSPWGFRVKHDSATELTEWWIWGIFQVYESPQVSGGGSR